MKDIKSMTLAEIGEDFKKTGVPAFRAKQVFEWLNKGVVGFDGMTDLPKDFRDVLSSVYYIANAVILKKLVSEIDGTVKYLFELNDGNTVESVVMNYHHGLSMCLSTQVGCKMGCTFCATGADGFTRDLTASEIISQITTAQTDLKKRISNIVLMGMGEPLDNYNNLIRFLELVNNNEGLNIGSRHITVSTCGIVPKINELADFNNQLTISVSLHASNDKIRDLIMPVNRKYNIDSIINSCKKYTGKSSRRVTFEYILLDGINDSPEQAKELSGKLKGMLCHVNLIPANNVPGKGHKASSKQKVIKFAEILTSNGINATVRRTLGADINASCGQLRKNNTAEIYDETN